MHNKTGEWCLVHLEHGDRASRPHVASILETTAGFGDFPWSLLDLPLLMA